MKVAALYVETDGIYYGLPDVDPWDEARDARTYAGPWPVVAHPPCAAWSAWAWLRERDTGRKQGDDGGCFEAALEAVRHFGGVLEHPARSKAWAAFALPRPGGPHWTRAFTDPGWVCEIDQALYGFPTRKPTWLYYVGEAPAEMSAATPALTRGCKTLHSGHRIRTPLAFRDLLLGMVEPLPKSKGTR